MLLPSTIKGITTHPFAVGDNGDIGRIIAGGDVKNVTTESLKATVHGIYAGDGIFRTTSVAGVSTGGIDFNTIEAGNQSTFSLAQSNGVFKPAASVKNVKVSIGAGLEVFAGSGQSSDSGTGGVGGSIANVDVIKSFSSSGTEAAIFLFAGDGGNGKSGGAGGSITGFTDEGSTTVVRVQTGHGGNGFDGNGGDGGSFLNSTITTKSPAYRFAIGAGGDGSLHGGDGGSVKGLAFTSNIVTSETIDAAGARSTGTLIASGDFNGDGLNDVVVVNATNGDAIVSLANGDGTFTQVVQPDNNNFVSPVGLTPTDIVTGDFNGDGVLDFAVSYVNSDNIGIFTNHGNGQFDGAGLNVATSPYRLAVGDFSGTPALDLAYLSLPDSASTGTSLVSHVFVAQNDGVGNFTPKITGNSITAPVAANDLIAAPIDADAHTDLFVSLDDTTGSVLALTASSVISGAPFNNIATIQTGVSHITNLDATVVNSTLHLLAFSSDIAGGSSTTAAGTATDVTPALRLLTINAAGQQTSNLGGSVVSGSTLARFVGSAGDYGVLTPTSIQITSLDGLTSKSYTAADGQVINFTPYGADNSDSVAAVGALPTRFFVNEGNSLVAAALPVVPQVFSFVGGDGGHGGSMAGGKGGGIKTLTFSELLAPGADSSGGTYTLTLAAGKGGDSDGATGGGGGNLNKMVINLDPADIVDGVDDTTLLNMHAGAGGVGAAGGKGGSITGLTATATYDQTSDNGVATSAFAADLEAGVGGVGLQGKGGNGGTVTLSGKASLTGVSFYDLDSPLAANPALIVLGGAGGVGATSGGAGGSVVNVGSQNTVAAGGQVAVNQLSSAVLVGGTGGAGLNGAGGAGGDVLTADVSVQAISVTIGGVDANLGGSLQVFGGNGGASTGSVGGRGGTIKGSTLASVQGDSAFNFFGVLAAGGAGGDGTLGGGDGGAIQKLTLNSPSDPLIFAAALFGGDGGAALESGHAGTGGAVKGITQTKDVNSSISVILAGAGGAGGGVGGSVKNINTVGFIGSPNSALQQSLGVFNPSVNSPAVASFFADGVVAQGIFAGRGEGGNGLVKNVTARQIAAIGAAPDANGLFAPAASVSKINADLIGFESNRDNVFESSDGGSTSPANARPIDGFIIANVVSEINTVNNGRTADFTFIG